MSAPELSVVCRSCGSEVSPYVTECPYCGTRIRKRAPKLERHGDELTAQEPRRRRRRRAREPREGVFPYASLATVIASALTLLTLRALVEVPTYLGAIFGDAGSEWWRYLAAPFVYDSVGYLFVIGCAVMIFGPPVERRLGSLATAVLMVACGGLGMLLADVIEGGLLSSSEPLLAAGGNGIALGLLCAWAAMRRAEIRSSVGEEADLIGAAVVAAVLVLLPVFVDWANVWAGLGGAAVGAACGLAASLARRPRSLDG